MKFKSPLGILLCTLSIVIAAVGWQSFWAVWDVRDVVKHSSSTLSSIDRTIDRVNAPCTGFHGSVTCGTLAQLNQSLKIIGIMAGNSTEQVKNSANVILAVQQTLTGISRDIKTEMAALKLTTDAATGLLKAGTTTAGIVNDPTTGIQPLLGHLDATIADTDTAVKTNSPLVARTLKATAEVGEQGVVITTNTAKVTTHFEKLIDTPHKPGVWGTLAYWLQIASNLKNIL